MLLLCTTLSQAYADKLAEAQSSFSSYRSRVLQLQSAPESRYLTAEYSSLTQWVAEAERLLRENEEEEFIQAVQLVRVQLRFVEVALEELALREQLLSQSAEADRAEGKAKQEREAVVALERAMGGSLSAPAAPSQVRPSGAMPPAAPVTAPPVPPRAPSTRVTP